MSGTEAAHPSWRRFGPVVLVGLASAGLLAVAAGRTWATATPRTDDGAVGGMPPAEATGADVAPLVLPLALVALAAWGAVLVLRRRGRRVVAVVGLLAAGGASVAALMLARTASDVAARQLGDVPADISTSPWPYVAGAAGLVAAVTFAVAWLAAPGWPEMSARYDAPTDEPHARAPHGHTAGGEMDSRGLWKALDEGEDPTA